MIVNANSLQIPIADKSVHCAITSPPYWGLRDYGVHGQLGLEPTPEEYCADMVAVFREVWRVMRDDATLWLNLGDSYNGSAPNRTGNNGYNDGRENRDKRYSTGGVGGLKPKDLVGIPWRVAFALRADGWYLRSDIIWSKPNPMPESVTDRPTKAHEYLFLLSKSARYFYDAEAIKEAVAEASLARYEYAFTGDPDGSGKLSTQAPKGMRDIPNGRNRRTVWEIATQPTSYAHFATFPEKLVEPCILAGTSARGACPVCGAPWERVVDHQVATSKDCPKTQSAHEARGGSGKPVGTVGKSGGGRIEGYTTTTGWNPTCTHDAEPIPCVVFDPFAGSGTTLRVAINNGRRGIGCELNYAYIHDIASRRLTVQMGMGL